jgi:alkylation response protein AidB-like acyl-CoA dehydrogenase
MRTDNADSAEEAAAALLARMAPVLARARENAQLLDQDASFPIDDVEALRHSGALAAVVPTLLGGLGLGTEPARSAATSALLQAVGGASIALGRIMEGHVNAVRLVMRNGSPAQCRAIAADARAGHLFALWVTDGPEPLRYSNSSAGIALQGGKHFCSAAGYASRAVVTAANAAGETRLLVLPLQCGERVRPLPAGMQGVRSATTARVCFDGVCHPADALFGPADIYLSEPEFSAGAWRASAVTAGALAALVEAARAELAARGRADNPDQSARLGRMFIHAGSARLWVRHAAEFAEDADRQPEFAVATVNLARIAIESACLETIALVQRSLGMSAFLRNNPVERMARDLATYLRQPAPDEALHAAAKYFTEHPEAMQ